MLVFDCEIKRCIPDLRKNHPHNLSAAGLEYCEGWHDFAGMGIATICVHDMTHNVSHVFCEDNMHLLRHMFYIEPMTAGFNSELFDCPLLAANGVLVPREHYDLRREVLIAAGKNPDAPHDANRGYSLDAICKANGLPGKNGDGAMAPVLWQRKQYGTVINYCLNDVMQTVTLIRRCPGLKDPVTGKWLDVHPYYQKPWFSK